MRDGIYWRKEFGLEAVPDLERGSSGSAVGFYIVGEFGKGKQVCPIVLLVVAEDAEELFDFLIYAFCFSVGLGVKSCRQCLVDMKFGPCFSHDFGGKLRTSV